MSSFWGNSVLYQLDDYWFSWYNIASRGQGPKCSNPCCCIYLYSNTKWPHEYYHICTGNQVYISGVSVLAECIKLRETPWSWRQNYGKCSWGSGVTLYQYPCRQTWMKFFLETFPLSYLGAISRSWYHLPSLYHSLFSTPRVTRIPQREDDQ